MCTSLLRQRPNKAWRDPLGKRHRRYALVTNRRQGWRGHLWQERFASCPMDEAHLAAAIRYVLLNPVRAGLVGAATDWPHSSARAHIWGESDSLVNPLPVARRIFDWSEYLRVDNDDPTTELIRRHSRIGHPLGDPRR